ncbi:MAG: putative quinol monooxygenase [Syntrophales bacterium]|jgi:quinol monooxygenase YgiN
MVGVIAKLKIKEGKVDEALKVFEGLLENVKKEEGTIYYTLNKDMADPNMIVIVERYKDMAAFQTHAGTPHFSAFSKQISAYLDAGLEMILLEEVASI